MQIKIDKSGESNWIYYPDEWKMYAYGEDFDEIGAAFEEEHEIKKGLVGDAISKLMNQRELVDFAVKWIEANRK